MFEHIVVFRFKEQLTQAMEKELITTMLAFQDHIPGIVDLSAGLNVTDETANAHSYSLGLRITFESREALNRYLPHPAHQAFVHMLEGLIDNVVVVDYPIL